MIWILLHYAIVLACVMRILLRPHRKTLVVDGKIALIGSANMDRRSFDLNYENNILLVDRQTCRAIRQRQDSYMAETRVVTPDEVATWSLPRRLWQNAVAIIGPIL